MFDKVNSEVDLFKVPISALRHRSRDKLSCMLNRPKVIKSMPPDCLPRDYRGLAHLMDLHLLSGWLGENPMEKMLSICDCGERSCTIGEFQGFLEKLDRYDVIDDTAEMFQQDAIEYEKKAKALVQISPMCQSLDTDVNILTLDDIIRIKNGSGPQIYDAFILYVESDRPFAEKVIATLEDNYRLKICDKDRDLAAGVSFEHNAVMRLISERCHKLLVILSDEFVLSDRHTFFLKYAHAITYDLGKRKVIPCTYKKCNLPLEYCAYFRLDFERSGPLSNFWDRLHTSIAPIFPCNADPLPWIEELSITDGIPVPEIEKNDTLSVNNTIKKEFASLKNKMLKSSVQAKYAADDTSSYQTDSMVEQQSEEPITNSKLIDATESYSAKKKAPNLLSGFKFKLKKKKKQPVPVCIS